MNKAFPKNNGKIWTKKIEPIRSLHKFSLFKRKSFSFEKMNFAEFSFVSTFKEFDQLFLKNLGKETEKKIK